VGSYGSSLSGGINDCCDIAPGSFGCGSGGGNSSSACGAGSGAVKVVAIYDACKYQLHRLIIAAKLYFNLETSI
jgi:hypothetical protein